VFAGLLEKYPGLLEKSRGRSDVVVLALPRGAVPAAYEVASALEAPLHGTIEALSGTGPGSQPALSCPWQGCGVCD
jgi:hypothetical protein